MVFVFYVLDGGLCSENVYSLMLIIMENYRAESNERERTVNKNIRKHLFMFVKTFFN